MERKLVGIAVSPGVAVATVLCIRELPVELAKSTNNTHALQELVRFETALGTTLVELKAIERKVASDVGDEEAGIFRAHTSIAQDATLTSKVRRLISEERMTAIAALQSVRDEYERVFADVADEYLRERLLDVRDVLERIAQSTAVPSEEANDGELASDPVILITQELLPSDVIALNGNNVVGIVTEGGGKTSHAAILARSYGIPAVAGVCGVLDAAGHGDSIVVDGTNGIVLINPEEEKRRAYAKLQREFSRLRKRLIDETSGAATTKDGVHIELLANISSPTDAVEASRVRADGVGLYRTEFFYLTSTDAPTEEEQLAEYRRVLTAAPHGPVTIRTLDLGGDKTIPYLAHYPEANPFMGWRSIRLSFEHPQLFREQLSAILRVSDDAQHEIRLMFPMITTYDELIRVRAVIVEVEDSLRARGLAFGQPKVGLMVEVPAAAIMIRDLLDVVDFVSIGTNDLIQYVTAADRDNPKVCHLCQASSPALLRLLQGVIQAANDAGKSVSVCGEMAGAVRSFPLLLALGLRSFSMSPSFVPVIRDFASHVTADSCEALLRHVWSCKSSGDVQVLTDRFVLQNAPELESFLIG